MVKLKNYIYASVLAVGGLLTACSDSFLDKQPDERTEIDTEAKVLQLITTSYPYSNYGWICELSSDNIADNNAPHLPSTPNVKQVVTHYNLSAFSRADDELFRFEPVKSATNQDTPSSVWYGYYTAIHSINAALDAIDKLAEENGGMTDNLRRARAEALLVRAFSHFILVNVFSQAYKDDEASSKDVGVPYVTEIEDVVQKDYDRLNVATVYARIQEDLEEGLKDIGDASYELPKWHFNLNAAHAFAARFYLFYHKWDKVLEHANAVLTNNITTASSMLMSYDAFDDCTYSIDYAEAWQSPYIANNLMLLNCYSVISRHARQRYSQCGPVVRDIYYHSAPMWRGWQANPTAYVSGMLFRVGSEDYGFWSAKIAEEFEISNKVSRTGWPHTIRREFTCTALLLERAEAKIMTGDYAGAAEDLIAYATSIQTFSEANRDYYGSRNGMTPLTTDMILSWFANEVNPNCFADWSFTQRMSSKYVIPAEATPYMNCLNYFRRLETNFDGLRFFDLKRWGIEYSHFYGPSNIEYRLTWDDPRRAIEVPQEALAAGMEPSQPQVLGEEDPKAFTMPSGIERVADEESETE